MQSYYSVGGELLTEMFRMHNFTDVYVFHNISANF